MSASRRVETVVTVTFVADRRGRIPFAVLGAFLLLSSSFYAVSLAPPQPTEPVADELVTDTQVETRIAMDAAIRDASRSAAAGPVIEPTDSGIGSVISADNPFRDALKLRIASAVRASVDDVTQRRDGLEASVSMAPIGDRESARQAMDGVSIRQVATERYRVRVENIHLTLMRNGQPLDTIRYNATVTTRLPAIELHERTNRYESALNAGIDESGLTQDLTARLFPIVGMRGYAQYGGAPIENVLANRHVEVMSNDALLAQQAAVFGVEDSAGRTETRRAAAAVATRDLFLGAEEAVKSLLSKPQGEASGAGEPAGSPDVPIPGIVDNEQSVDASHKADVAYLGYLDGEDGRSLAEIVDAIYRGEVRVVASATRQSVERESFGTQPENGTRLYTETSTDRQFHEGAVADGRGTSLKTYRGKVVEETVTTTYWTVNRSLETTKSLQRDTYRVRIDLEGRYREPGIAPNRPDAQFPFGSKTTDRLRRAGIDRLMSGSALEQRALAAVDGAGSSDWQSVDIDPPEAVMERAHRETAGLRRAVQNVSVTLDTRSIASSTNPAAELADRLEANRDQLLETPNRYDSLADRAVAASRITYFERVTGTLNDETPLIQQAQNAFADKLKSHMIPSSPPERSAASADDYVTNVEGGPAYLSVDPPDGTDPALAARNVNLFTVPYGDTADAITEQLGAGGQKTVSLRTAAQTLAVLEETQRGNNQDRRALRRELGGATEAATVRYRQTVAKTLGDQTAATVVESAMAEWPAVHERALAVADGQMAESIADELPSHLSRAERDRLRVALRVTSANARSNAEVRVAESLVERARQDVEEGASPMVSESAKAGATEATKRAWERGTGKQVGSLPAGLPLLPMPGSWYATANAWEVGVEGRHERFVVATRRAAPGGGTNGTVEYVRADRTVRTDIDNDGQPEALGRNRPIRFEVHTGAVIVVPPGRTGVGDVDGNAIETSSGW